MDIRQKSPFNHLFEFSPKRAHVYQCAHTNYAALDADRGRLVDSAKT